MSTENGRSPQAGRATRASHGAADLDIGTVDARRLHHSAGIPNAVRVVLLCDESGKNAVCQEVAVVADMAAFRAYAETEYANAQGCPERGYVLCDRDGKDLNFTLVSTQYEVLTALAIEARRAETVQHGSVHESAGPKDNAHD